MRERLNNLIRQVIVSEFPISIEYLKQSYSVSSRTLRNDVREINDFLDIHDLPNLYTIRGKGLYHSFSEEQIELLTEMLLEEVKEEYFNRDERILDILLSIAFSSKPVFVYQKESEFRISKSTIDEDMRILRQKLQDYKIDIVSIPKQGLKLIGEESAIRTMLYSVIVPEVAKIDVKSLDRYSKVIDRYLPNKMLKKLNDVFDDIVEHKGDRLHKLHFNLFTSIWVLRTKCNYLISQSDIPVGEKIDNNDLNMYIFKVCEECDLVPVATELNYVYKILQSFNVKKDISPINWLQLQILTFDLIRFVEKESGVPFTIKESSLQKMLYNHIISMVSRVQNDVQLTNPLKDKIKESYGLIYKAVLKFSSIIEEELGKKILEDEIAFLTIHFSTSLSEINQGNTYWYRAVVVCNHGIATGKMLSENLKEYFNIEVVAILSSSDVSLIKKLDVDLVFSTVDIQYTEKPLLVVDSIIQEETKLQIKQFLSANSEARRILSSREDFTQFFREILELTKTIGEVSEKSYAEFENLFDKYDLSINKREVQPMIQDLLSDKNILITEEEFDWRDSIRYVAQPLKEQNVVTESYIDAMIKSVEEYGPYIVIGPNLALAHARPDDGAQKLGLSLAIFEKPVIYGQEEGQDVKVVFCLSAVDSFSHLEVMKNLVNLIREKEKIEQLADARDIETVKEILFKT